MMLQAGGGGQGLPTLWHHTPTRKKRQHSSSEKKSLRFRPHNEPRSLADPHLHAKALTRAGQTDPAGNLLGLSQGSDSSTTTQPVLKGTYLLCPIPLRVFVKHSASKGLSNTQRSHPLLPPRPHHLPLVEITNVAGSYPAKRLYTFKQFHRRVLLPSVCEGSTACLQEGSQAQLHVPWAPGCKGQWRNLVPTFWASADCSWANPSPERRWTALELGTARPAMWWHSPSLWSLGFAGPVLPRVLYPALH